MALRNFFKKKKSRRRFAVIGLDGTSFGLIKDLSARGIMPAMGALLDDGFACEMYTALPPVSSVTWTSFLTGVNPAKHGIFGFMDRRRDSYGIYFPNATQVQSPALYDLLGSCGKKTIALNIPQTYPARRLSGMMISGPVSIDLDRAVYPPRLVSALKKTGYRINVDSERDGCDASGHLLELRAVLKKRADMFLYLMDNVPWDVFIAVFTGAGTIDRLFRNVLCNTGDALYEQAVAYFRELDTVIGRMAERLDPDTGFAILSDHGCAGLKKQVSLNAWLKQQGLLFLNHDEPISLEDIDPGRTKAFALDPSRVCINTKGVMPCGCVEPGREYDRICKMLNEAFLSLKDPECGDPVIQRAFRRDELYSGPLIERSPDFVLCPHPGYDLNASFSRTAVFGTVECSGMNTAESAFLYVRGLRGLSRKPHIYDLVPTMLSYLHIPVPDGMDGRPILC